MTKKIKYKLVVSRVRQGIATDLASIKRTLQDYYKQLYVRELDNLEEMSQFFEKHKLSQITQDETDHLPVPYLLRKLNS